MYHVVISRSYPKRFIRKVQIGGKMPSLNFSRVFLTYIPAGSQDDLQRVLHILATV